MTAAMFYWVNHSRLCSMYLNYIVIIIALCMQVCTHVFHYLFGLELVEVEMIRFLMMLNFLIPL